VRARAFLDAADRLPLVGLDDLIGDGGAVVVAPHPDDESLGCGALLAEVASAKRRGHVVIVSDGVGSHPRSKAYPPARLRALREGEAREAVKTLGLGADDLTFLGLPDRFVPAEGPEAAAASAIVARLCREIGARALFTTWRHDPHCDHRAAYALARVAQRQIAGARLFEYSIWGRSLPDDAEIPAPPRGFRFDGAARLALKQAAIACHRSQVGPLIDDDPSGFRLSPIELARLSRPDEVFLEYED
jgi:LmbE family N-acetylglucosaminyl deacetylase